MITPTLKRVAAAVLATITLTMVTSVAPASADDQVDARVSFRGDTGWNGI